jgi:putative ABC transport system permease protein
MIASIAWKNVWRNKTRSLVVIIATVLGLIGGTFAGAFMFGMIEQRLGAAVDKEVSHIQLHNPSFPENNEIGFTISNPDSVCRILAGMEGVKAVSGRTKIMGMIASANSSGGVQIYGINPEEEKKVTTLYQAIPDTCGNYFTTGNKNQIVLGAKLAEKLKVKLRSKIVLRFQDTTGNIIEAAFKIAGIYNTYNDMFDDKTVFIRKTDLSFLLSGPAPVHEIAIYLSDPANYEKTQAKISTRFPGLLVQSWKEISPELALIVDVVDQMIYIFLGIILLALAFGIVNTMLMAVLERTKELGMLMSIGMNRSRVFRMIMTETIWLTCTGGIIGMFFSYLLIAFFHQRGIDLSVVGRGMEALGYESVIYPSIHMTYYIVLSVMILLTGILSSIYPARKALKIQPAEAIKME